MMKINAGRLKNEVRKSAYSALYRSGVLAHKTSVEWENVLHLECDEGEVKALYNCSNTLYHIKSPMVEGYFRPILQHEPLKKCVRTAIDEYFEKVHPEQLLEKEALGKTLEDKAAFRKLMDVGSYSDPYSRARKFYLTKDTTIVGIETPQFLQKGSDEWKDYIWNIDHFLKYVMNAMARHQRNQCGGRWEFSNANRQMATEAMAVLLGLDDMIPHSEFAVLTYQGEKMRGTLMAVARGVSTEGIIEEQSQRMASPALQRELTSLNVLDAITFERDHRPGNYNVVLDDDGQVAGLSVFDNDAAMTFAPIPVVTRSGSGSCVVSRGGVINRPHLDKQLAQRILAIKKREVKEALKPYMNWIQVAACCRRFETLRKAIMQSAGKDGFLLDSNAWSVETMNEELSGQYGKTYLDTFIHNESFNRAFLEYNTAAAL